MDPCPTGSPRRRVCALLAAFALVAPTAPALAQPGPAWRLVPLAGAGTGTRGARAPALAAGGPVAAFQHDGDVAPAGAGNGDGNSEIFAWDEARGLAQITATAAGGGSYPQQATPSVSADGRRIAFVSNADLAGGNADRTPEVFVWDAAAGFRQVSDGGPGSAAEAPALSRDGTWLAYWHTGDRAAGDPARGPRLYVAAVGGARGAITPRAGQLYHSRPAVGDGTVAFVLEADLTGGNVDASWELFVWSGSPIQPAAGAFRQITDWHPPMTGREILDPSISRDGRHVAFAGRGHVDASLPGGHVPLEVYRWTDGAPLERLTTATGARTSSAAPRISDDGRQVWFVSQADLTGGNPDGNTELYRWSEGAGIAQVTATRGTPNVIAVSPDLVPGVDGRGAHGLYLAERADDPGPLVFTSRRALPVLAGPATPDPSPTAVPVPSVTPTAVRSPAAPSPTAGTPGPGPTARVCPQIQGRVPPAVVSGALAQPETVEGWGQPERPASPIGPFNPPRAWLSIRDLGKPFGPANGVIWRAGCP